MYNDWENIFYFLLLKFIKYYFPFEAFYISISLWLLLCVKGTGRNFKSVLPDSQYHSYTYAESISAWSNYGSVMCLLSTLNQ